MTAAEAAGSPGRGGILERLTPGAGLLSRAVLAAVFAWAAWAKIADPVEAVNAVRGYEILPEAVVKPIGYGLPFFEVGLAGLLVVGFGTRATAVLSGLLLVVFIAGIAQAWARGLTIDCGCFGGGGEVSASETRYPQEILRDVGLLALAALLVWRPRTPLSLDAWLVPKTEPALQRPAEQQAPEQDETGKAQQESID